MDSSEALTGFRLIVAIAVLSYASMLDLRTRKIGNSVWIGLSVVAFALLPIQLAVDEQPWEYLLIIVPILAILSDVYWDVEEDSLLAKAAPAAKYAVAIVAVAFLSYMWMDESYLQHLLAVPILMLIIVLMYMLDLIRGGADAKALMALSILFPFYPAIDSLPILTSNTESGELLFPFTFVVLITAAIIVAFFPLGFVIKNAAAREFRAPQGLLGYKMNASEIPGRHVWLMERMEDGVHRLYTRPKTTEDLGREVQLLVDAGFKRIWVTPKIPFIVPMLIALIFSTIIGNIFWLML